MVRFSASPKNEPHSLSRASEASAWLSNYFLALLGFQVAANFKFLKGGVAAKYR
ncbi:MAG: hypothetical protein U5L45_07015 [Saprospiraceae bacterium]|nr:hypothetical protein [Saprospiraceae bacterium]